MHEFSNWDLRNCRLWKGRKDSKVHAMIVPGVDWWRTEEEEGLHHVFVEAGFEWRGTRLLKCLATMTTFFSPVNDVLRLVIEILKVDKGKEDVPIWLVPSWQRLPQLWDTYRSKNFNWSSNKNATFSTLTAQQLSWIRSMLILIKSFRSNSWRRLNVRALAFIFFMTGVSLMMLGKNKSWLILNQSRYQGAQILVAGDNFAVAPAESMRSALLDYGFRSIIAPSFADIFYNNCAKNGILLVACPKLLYSSFSQKLKKMLAVNSKLISQSKVQSPKELEFSFEIDPFVKHRLLNGLDDIDGLASTSLRLRVLSQITRNKLLDVCPLMTRKYENQHLR